jgi:hypothetical protein
VHRTIDPHRSICAAIIAALALALTACASRSDARISSLAGADAVELDLYGSAARAYCLTDGDVRLTAPDVVMPVAMTREASGPSRAASREGMVRLARTVIAAPTLGASCGMGTSGQDGRITFLPIAGRDSAMIEIVDQLSNVPAGSLQISDVARSFGVELVRVDQSGIGEKYANGATPGGFQLEVFVLPDDEFRLSITHLDNQAIADWRAQLPERGWSAEAPILHPFLMDSFQKDGKQIRLEHNSAAVSSITVFGLNASGGE